MIVFLLMNFWENIRNQLRLSWQFLTTSCLIVLSWLINLAWRIYISRETAVTDLGSKWYALKDKTGLIEIWGTQLGASATATPPSSDRGISLLMRASSAHKKWKFSFLENAVWTLVDSGYCTVFFDAQLLIPTKEWNSTDMLSPLILQNRHYNK